MTRRRRLPRPCISHISKIVVTKFPATTSNGGGWDLASGPDIYPLFSNGATTIYESPDYLDNASGSGQTFTPKTGIEIISPSDEYSLSLYDYDFPDSDDLMGKVSFKPYSNDHEFPDEITVDTGGAVAFRLTVTYSF
jgi:hypothetical protein